MTEIEWPGEEFLCQCHVEAVRLMVSDDGVSLAMWNHAAWGGRMRWRQRLPLIWRILTEGKAFNDEVALDHDQADRLARRILAATSKQPQTITLTGTWLPKTA